MSARRNAANRIRGPQSALTDFLASNNISAAQIRIDYQNRRAAASPNQAAQAGADAADTTDQQNASPNGNTNAADSERQEDEEDEDEEEDEEETLTAAQKRKRKRQQEAAIEKIKKSKQFKKKKKDMAGEPGEDDDDEMALDMYEKSRPPPGQLENCEICDKRFTVTPYSKEGPRGGLLCGKCSKELKDEEKKSERQKKKAAGGAPRGRRRAQQSKLMDGDVRYGARSLVDVCIQKVADNNNDIDDFGDIGDNERLVSRVATLFSKRRVLQPRTLPLFLRPDYRRVDLFDCGKLETDSFAQIFAIIPQLRHLNLRNAGQMKDSTIDYMMSRNIKLEHLQLEACNLIGDQKWREYFARFGADLKSLKLSWLDFAMDDATVEVIVKNCPNLTRLKLKRCFKVGESSLYHLAELQRLEHLSLYFMNPCSVEAVNHLLSSVGETLQTLSLERFDQATDDTLDIIHQTCTKLQKLRFSHNDYVHDSAYTALFTDWANPGLRHADFGSTRDVDNTAPEGPQDAPVGLGDAGLRALMAHSSARLETLNLASCRHLTRAGLVEVFGDRHRQYPNLRYIDLSLIPSVDDVVVTGIFRSCPALQRLTVFACFGVRSVVVPKDTALIGTPYAQESIVQMGTELG